MKKVLLCAFILFFRIQTIFVYSQNPAPYFEPREIDSSRSLFGSAGIPLITDFEKDGQSEIVTFSVAKSTIVQPITMLHVLDSKGNNYRNFPKGFDEVPLDFASGDLDGNDYLELVVRFNNKIDALDLNGNRMPGFPIEYITTGLDQISFVSLFDLDNDGKLEIIVSRKNEICVYNFNGTVRDNWPRRIPGFARYNPAICDLDNDGNAELIFNTYKPVGNNIDSAAIFVFKENGTPFGFQWPLFHDSGYYSWSSSPSVFQDKQNKEIILLNVSGKIIDGMAFGRHKFLKINKYGEVLTKKYYQEYYDYGTLVIGDLDKDGLLEFATGTQTGFSLSAFDNSLNRLKGWPQNGGGEHYATAFIGKLTYDNSLNVINNTWIADDSGGYIFAYKKDASNLSWSPLRSSGLVNSIAFSDINNDGNVELVSLSTKTGNETILNIWTFPGIQFNQENFPWPQYGHDRYHTNQYGFIPPDEPVGIQPISTTVPDKFSLHQNYPNPFNPVTNLEFWISKSGFVSLKVYNALGKELVTLVNDNLSPGTYKVVFDGSEYSSGVYFYKLQTEDFQESKRMILLK